MRLPSRERPQSRPFSCSTAQEITLAALERSINPTVIDPSEIQRLKNSKWFGTAEEFQLPPLAESARALTTPNLKASTPTSLPSVEQDSGSKPSLSPSQQPSAKTENDQKPPAKRHIRLPKIESTSLPNIPLSNNRFPRKELKRASQCKKALVSNPSKRFVVAIAERAFREEAKAKHREEEIKKVQEASGAIAWHIIRPLSRDPKFGRYIAALQNANTENHNPSQFPESSGRPETSESNATEPADSNNPHHSKQTKERNKAHRAKELTPLQASTSFTELQKAIAKSVFRPKRRKELQAASPAPYDEEPYVFGKPAVLHDEHVEEYSRTFKELVVLGSNIRDTLKGSETDKHNFSIGRSKVFVEQQSLKPGPEPVLPKPPTARSDALTPKNQRRNPAVFHRQQFIEVQTKGKQHLTEILEARRKDRLDTCMDKERLRPVFRLVEDDIKAQINFKNDATWIGHLPYLWVADAEERLKNRETDGHQTKTFVVRRGATNIAAIIAQAKERAAMTNLLSAHGRFAALAGHNRQDSIVLAAKKMEEFQKLMEGRDIIAERSITDADAVTMRCDEAWVAFLKTGVLDAKGQPPSLIDFATKGPPNIPSREREKIALGSREQGLQGVGNEKNVRFNA
ncbi:hypothetical protein HDU97_002943 [Phlyctochytrium planicorne]|nr:hypothetical protein HDU97_002943 [Phlyctochytrium planicorne]